jgi:hypothetical protein
MNRFRIGDRVAWTMGDGGHDTLYLTRVDGGAVSLPAHDARPATPEDILGACKWFEALVKCEYDIPKDMRPGAKPGPWRREGE